MNYIILNGNDSRNIKGLLIQSLPPITKPLKRTSIEEIDGRDGSIVTPLGYSAYERTVSIGLYGQYDVDEVIGFFNTSGTAVFSNEPDKIYTYQVLNQIDFQRLVRYRTAEIVFYCQPYKFSIAESPLTLKASAVADEGTSVTLNPTTEGEVINSLRIYGNSVQEDTPTTDSPATIQNVSGAYVFTVSGADGSTSATVNLGTAFLSKVGDYQDYIYRGKLKRTNVGRFMVNVEDIIADTSFSNVVYAKIPKRTTNKSYGNTIDIPCLCSHAVYSSGAATEDGVNKIFSQADAVYYYIGFAIGTTLEQMKTALTGCAIYYPLLLPFNADLSEATQQDFESVMQIEMYAGTTAITTSGSVLPYLKVTTLNDAFDVHNIGNIESQPKVTIVGSGLITVMLNGKKVFTVNMTDVNEITIDGAAMEAYNATGLKNRLVSGDYNSFKFKTGKNRVLFRGNALQATFENYSRWI